MPFAYKTNFCERVAEPDTVWTTHDGRMISMHKMTVSHLSNTINMLERKGYKSALRCLQRRLQQLEEAKTQEDVLAIAEAQMTGWPLTDLAVSGNRLRKYRGLLAERDRRILMDGYDNLDVVVLTQRQFAELGEYSCSIPTGTTIGKRWRRNLDAYSEDPVVQAECRMTDRFRWVMGEYVEDPDPEMVGIKWSRIKLQKVEAMQGEETQ